MLSVAGLTDIAVAHGAGEPLMAPPSSFQSHDVVVTPLEVWPTHVMSRVVVFCTLLPEDTGMPPCFTWTVAVIAPEWACSGPRLCPVPWYGYFTVLETW